MFVIETLSKPPWQQQQKHGQTKDSVGTQIAQYVHFQILLIFYLFSKTNNVNHQNLHGLRTKPLMANYLPLIV